MNQYTDKLLENDNWIIQKIHNECIDQVHKWGIETRSAFEWLTYTTEELGELAKAISEYEYRKGTKEQIVKEAVQVATLALKIAEMFDESNKLTPYPPGSRYGLLKRNNIKLNGFAILKNNNK